MSDCTLNGALQSEDTEVMVECLRRLGYARRCRLAEPANRSGSTIRGAASFPRKTADLFVGNSGTTMRFLTAMVASGDGPLPARRRAADARTADPRPARRAESARGVNARSETGNGCPPVIIEATDWTADGSVFGPTSAASSSAAC